MHNLLSVYSAGVIALFILFMICFVLVHIAQLVNVGWNAQRKPQHKNIEADEPKEKPPAKPPTNQEPVYYIVERKRRAKSSYSEPKQIRFK